MFKIPKEPFNEKMDEILLQNDFAYYDDWEYGPVTGWTANNDHYSLKLMKHSFGYWLIISKHASGENPSFNIGSSNNANEILAVTEALKILW
jgi:hypothetical protein